MKTENSKSTNPRPVYLRVLYILALITLVVYILTVGSSLLIPITLAAFLSMLVSPVAEWLEKKRLGRFLGALIPVLGLLFVFALLTSLAVRQITSIGGSLEGAGGRIDNLVEQVNYFLSWHLDADEPVLSDFNSEAVLGLVKDSSGQLLLIMGGLSGSLFGAMIIPALIFFILYYRNHLFEFSVRLLRHAPRDEVGKQVEEARMVAQEYLVGMMKVVAILAILYSGSLFVIGVKHAIFFGIFAAMLNIVPFFGPLVGSVLPILFVLVMGDSLYDPLVVAGAFIVIQLIEGNFLTPRIIGSEVRINPLVAFIGLLGGAMIWGVIGMIIVIPVLSIAMQLFLLNPRTEPFAYLLASPKGKHDDGIES